jgi:photosystem II stability/assembly factor-like uncharacterized protein
MRPAKLASLTCLLSALFVVGLLDTRQVGLDLDPRAASEDTDAGPYPSDWFGLQRAYPGRTIPQEKFAAAVQQARFERAIEASKPQAGTLVWTDAGPYNIGGRVTGLAVVPGGTTIYLASANGGVFKSTNSGTDWAPIFDALSVYSIGAIALDPANPDVIYVGTGEANSSVDSYDGAGLFRSLDGGLNWTSLGLQATARIARVVVDPQNSARIFVAAMGTQFSTSSERGMYRSEDAGATWTRVLAVDDSTGVCDVVINPAHSDTMFAATWERIRSPSYRRAYGPGCGIWRSIDSGDTWTRLANGLPAPSDSVGRIGLAIAPSKPSTVFAQIIGGAVLGYDGLGMYRSTDGGDTWIRRDTGTAFTSAFGGFGWYFGDVAVDPANSNRVFAMGVRLRRSVDGGQTYGDITSNAHVDMHALWIDPANSQRIFLGSDGGFFRSLNGGSSWTKSLDLPTTQFYACIVDPANANRSMGGTQDNNTILTTGSPNAWTAVLGGDGFQCIIDPLDPDVLFAEYQYCSGGSGPLRSSNAGLSFSAPSGFSAVDRYNWNAPMVMSPSNHDVLLAGSQRVYRSTDNGHVYQAISSDLSSHLPASLVYGTLTTLDISPVDAGVYYAGTDDGRVWRSTNAGSTWEEISTGLPQRWVTRVAADRFDAQVVYATLSGFGLDESLPHVYRSANQGTTWSSIAANLPDVPVNDLVVDSIDPSTLFVATDVGVYASRNGGAGWFPLGSGMPVQTVFDLDLHVSSHLLVAATHGRGMWRLDLSGLPTDVAQGPAGELRLGLPFPNPSRRDVSLRLDLGAAAAPDARALVTVYDVSGRRIRVLHSGPVSAGSATLTWDGRDVRGVPVAAGVYFACAQVGESTRLQRIVRVE